MMLTLSDTQVIYAILSLIITIVGGIAVYRYYIHRSSRDHINNTTDKLISERTKYKKLDFLRYRSQRMGIGLAVSILLAVVAMSWTTYELSQVEYNPGPEIIEELEIVPRTDHPKPEPIKPPPPQEIEIEDEIIEEDQPDLFDSEIEEDDFIEEPPIYDEPVAAAPAPKLPMPEEPKDDIDEIHNFVQQKPRFGDCKDDVCTERELMKYLGKYIKYPTIALENGIHGRVTAQFVVEKDGSVSQIDIVRTIGGGCGKEVARVINKMNDQVSWEPGMQNGKPVRVRYTLPVTFKEIK